MFKDITIGQYFPGDTFIHKLDPRTKIFVSIMYIISLFFIDKFWPFTLILFFMATVIFIAKIPVKMVLRNLKPLIFILLLTFIINLFVTPGEVLYKLGPFTITKEGIKQAFFLGIRLIFLVTGAALLTLTTSPIDLTDGIESLLKPFERFGLPAHELAMMMTIALRFIPTLLEETDKIIKAQMARGADFESGNIIKKAKAMIPVLVPLFINSFRRADELAVAMEARCYRGGVNRTRMNPIIMEKIDYITLVISLIYFSIIISTRFI